MHASIYVKSNIALNSVRYLEAVGISSRWNSTLRANLAQGFIFSTLQYI